MNREAWITLIIFTVAFIFIYQYTFDNKIDLNGDNASYYILGKAIHAGEGFVNVNSINKTPNNHFPPGYPFIISIVMIFSSSFVSIKLVNGFFLAGSLFLSYLLVRKFSNSKTVAWITLLFLLLNTHFLRYGTIMMSEMPFLFFTLLSLTLFLKTYDLEGNKRIPYYLLAFLFLMVSFYLRTLGIALLAAFLFMLAPEYKTKWKVIIGYAGGFIITFLPWLIRSSRLGGNSYLHQLIMVNPYRPEMGTADLGDLLHRIVTNIQRYITREIPDVIFPFKTVIYNQGIEAWEWITGILILSLILIGIWKLHRFRWLAITYIASTFFILLIWPDVWVGVRFMLPLTPLLIMAMLAGIQWLFVSLSVLLDLKKTLPLWLVIGLLYFNISEVQFLHLKARKSYEPKWDNYFNLARSFKREGVKDVVVSCRKPSLFYLFSETFTTNYKYTTDPDVLLKDLQDRGVSYVILDQLGYSSTFRYLYPAIQNRPEYFEIIAKLENPDTYLLKFNANVAP